MASAAILSNGNTWKPITSVNFFGKVDYTDALADPYEFGGIVDELRIWSTQLSSEEISSKYLRSAPVDNASPISSSDLVNLIQIS